MKNYSFKNVRNIYVCGGLGCDLKRFLNSIKSNLNVKPEDADATHPMELEKRERQSRRVGPSVSMSMLKKLDGFLSHDFSNSLYLITGDCGFGFNSQKYYEDFLSKRNKIFSYNNVYVVFVRGNHDDPEYFDGNRVDYSNIKAVPDYSIVEACGKKILCVGGAISVDRKWRIEQEERINKFETQAKKHLYWPNEAPILNIDLLNEISKSNKIDYVVSHSAPSFINHSNVCTKEWVEKDSSIIDDVNRERLIMDKIYETLRDNNNRPQYWAYGHFHFWNLEKRSGTIFRSLADDFSPISVERDINSIESAEQKTTPKKKIRKFNYIPNPIAEENVLEVDEPMRDIDEINDEEGDVRADDILLERPAPGEPYANGGFVDMVFDLAATNNVIRG